MWLSLVLAYFFFVQSAFCLYTSSDDVIELTESNFNRVLSSDGIWLVEFYAPWCGHCQNLAPHWKKAATALKGVVNVAAVNAENEQSLSSKYSIKGFPTILIFGKDKKSPSPYNGERSADPIVEEALKQVSSLVRSRIGGKSSGGSRGSSDVIELTDSNFDTMVLGSDEPWLVEFYAPWCGHCKNLKPHWEKAASELKGVMKVAAVDATAHKLLSSKYGVQGFPTIKFFPAGPKKGDPEDYNGGRTSDDIVRWAQDRADSLLPAPEVEEITSREVFTEACENHPICIIAVLPTLYDCQAECRQNYLTLLKELGEVHKKQKWGWVWTEALNQGDLEQKFDLGGSGYPSLTAFHAKKKMRAPLRGPFNKEGIHDLLRSLLHGDVNIPLYPVPVMPQIEKRAAWDGKDAPPIEEEELDSDPKSEL